MLLFFRFQLGLQTMGIDMLRKLIFLLAILLIGASPCLAEIDEVLGQPVAAGEAAYCSGSELACFTFESVTSWDVSNGTSDCDLDDDGDYCDGDTSVKLFESKSLGLAGTNSNAYLRKNLSSADQGEYYLEGWVRFDDTAGAGQVLKIQASNANEQIRIELINPDKYWRIETADTAVGFDSTTAPSNSAWYHIGVYFLAETGSDNGTVRMWVNDSTTTGDFDAGDIIINEDGDVNTGTTESDLISLGGHASGEVIHFDNVKVVSGSPGWAY
jgi:hypothetical protein